MSSFVLPIFDPNGQAIIPNLTALAEDGVLFNNAYCNSPLCCPARACMFTGALSSENEVWGNGSEPSAIRAYLDGVGLDSHPPPVAPARPQPQTEFEYAG